MRILIPDARFPGEPDVERDALGAILREPGALLEVHRLFDYAAIPMDSWRNADAVIVASARLNLGAPTVALLDRCRIVVRSAVGVDNIDLAACAARDIPVCHVPDYGTEEVANPAMALMLALPRGLPTYGDLLGSEPVARRRLALAAVSRRLCPASLSLG